MMKYSRKLSKKVNQLERDFVISKVDKNDARKRFLIEMNKLNLWWNLQMSLYHKNYDEICEWISEMNPWIQSNEKLRDAFGGLDFANRQGLFVVFMFHLEVLISSIAKILPNPSIEKKYNKKITHILNELNIAKSGEEKHHVLLYPSIIRNSLHANGIHTDNDMPYGKIAGINFSFKKGKLTVGSWRVIYFLMDKILEIIEEIFEKEEIKKLNEIPHYAENK